jgi:hypothetical protein
MTQANTAVSSLAKMKTIGDLKSHQQEDVKQTQNILANL